MTFDPRRCFQSLLIHVQLLWELVLLGEPLVVMAPSPTVSSEVVLALVRYPNLQSEAGAAVMLASGPALKGRRSGIRRLTATFSPAPSAL